MISDTNLVNNSNGIITCGSFLEITIIVKVVITEIIVVVSINLARYF